MVSVPGFKFGRWKHLATTLSMLYTTIVWSWRYNSFDFIASLHMLSAEKWAKMKGYMQKKTFTSNFQHKDAKGVRKKDYSIVGASDLT